MLNHIPMLYFIINVGVGISNCVHTRAHTHKHTPEAVSFAKITYSSSPIIIQVENFHSGKFIFNSFEALNKMTAYLRIQVYENLSIYPQCVDVKSYYNVYRLSRFPLWNKQAYT